MTARDEHKIEALGAYVLGALDDDEARELDEHVADCAECRAQLAELTGMREALGELPPEAFLEGPPEGGDLLLQRTLRRVRTESSSTFLNRRVVGVAAAVVAVALALGGGVLLGRGNSGGLTTALPTPSTAPPSSATVVPGTRVVSVTQDGTRLTATITPAAGWIRVNASVTGIPQGQRCKIVVVSKSGEQEVAGSWVVSAKAAAAGTNLDGSALIDPSQVASIMVQNFDGHTFVSANL
jgi:anti-sigma factor RsiW